MHMWTITYIFYIIITYTYMYTFKLEVLLASIFNLIIPCVAFKFIFYFILVSSLLCLWEIFKVKTPKGFNLWFVFVSSECIFRRFLKLFTRMCFRNEVMETDTWNCRSEYRCGLVCHQITLQFKFNWSMPLAVFVYEAERISSKSPS